MNVCRFPAYYVAALVAACLIIPTESTSLAQGNKNKIPDFLQGDEIPKDAPHDWNLGPTGARGWIYSNRLETTEARQIYVTQVVPGSPADGVLQVGDVLLGVGKQEFSIDPRMELGKAISKAEAQNGNLELIRWRDGNKKEAVVKLAVLGSYSATAPFDCPKSSKIFEQGCAALAKKMKSNSRAGNGIVRSLNALALLSSGKEEYLPIVQAQVEWASKYSDPESRSLHSWFYGPVNMLLAEYTLATGDKSFMDDLERVTMEIVNGQSAVGSWGHRFSLPNGRLKGYGMMNAPGLPMTVSLILARQAGVDDPALDEAIEKSTRLIRFYVGKGSVPYGDHHPWIQTHDDNGKNGIAALMFNLLDDQEATQYFSRMSVASHSGDRELGHTGNYFNLLWAMPAVSLSGPNASGAWMEEYGWYYDLARRWDGTFQHQGPAQPKNDSYRGWDSTGAYLLAYAQPLRELNITGKKQGVAVQVDRSTAENLVADGRDYSHRLKDTGYSKRSLDELMAGLNSWSPVVRERSAIELARRPEDNVSRIASLLEQPDLYGQLGACQAISKLGKRAADAVPQLRTALESDDLWVQVKAADALASIGPKARPAIPELLQMLAEKDPEADPRGMLSRYLCFALFNRRSGLLRGSLDDVDRDALFDAVRAGLGNEDGRARGELAYIYQALSFEEIEPLLPAIHQAIVEPSPSGVMFADGIRLSGLEVFAKHGIEEGIELCIDVMEPDRWGAKNRIGRCLKSLRSYGGAAESVLPQLEELEKDFSKRKNFEKELELLRETISAIRSGDNPPQLRLLDE